MLLSGTRLEKGAARHTESRGGGGCHEGRGPRLLLLNRGFENQAQGAAADLRHVPRGAGVGQDRMRGWETITSSFRCLCVPRPRCGEDPRPRPR